MNGSAAMEESAADRRQRTVRIGRRFLCTDASHAGLAHAGFAGPTKSSSACVSLVSCVVSFFLNMCVCMPTCRFQNASRAMTRILRHGGGGIKLRADGYAKVTDVIECMAKGKRGIKG